MNHTDSFASRLEVFKKGFSSLDAIKLFGTPTGKIKQTSHCVTGNLISVQPNPLKYMDVILFSHTHEKGEFDVLTLQPQCSDCPIVSS